MKTNQLKSNFFTFLILAIGCSIVACSDDDNGNGTIEPDPDNTKYTVGAEVDGEGYFTTTGDLTSGTISVVGDGAEGWAALSVSADGYLYVLNNTEGLTEKYELTENGPVLITEISNSDLTAGGFLDIYK